MNCIRPMYFAVLLILFCSSASIYSQEPAGPQTSAPKPVAPEAPVSHLRRAPVDDTITVAAGTRMAVVLENGMSTRSAKPGDSLYLRTSWAVTQNNRGMIPVGSYLRGELLQTKRPGRVKGRGEFRMRLNTLILPTGYTVDLNAA